MSIPAGIWILQSTALEPSVAGAQSGSEGSGVNVLPDEFAPVPAMTLVPWIFLEITGDRDARSIPTTIRDMVTSMSEKPRFLCFFFILCPFLI